MDEQNYSAVDFYHLPSASDGKTLLYSDDKVCQSNSSLGELIDNKIGDKGYATQEYVTNAINDLSGTVSSEIGNFNITEGTDQGPSLDPTSAEMKSIYLIKDDSVAGSDQYKEWIVTENDSEEKEWTCIGDTSIDLSDYYTRSETSGADEISAALENKQDNLVPGLNIEIKPINEEIVSVKRIYSNTFKRYVYAEKELTLPTVWEGGVTSIPIRNALTFTFENSINSYNEILLQISSSSDPNDSATKFVDLTNRNVGDSIYDLYNHTTDIIVTDIGENYITIEQDYNGPYAYIHSISETPISVHLNTIRNNEEVDEDVDLTNLPFTWYTSSGQNPYGLNNLKLTFKHNLNYYTSLVFCVENGTGPTAPKEIDLLNINVGDTIAVSHYQPQVMKVKEIGDDYIIFELTVSGPNFKLYYLNTDPNDIKSSVIKTFGTDTVSYASANSFAIGNNTIATGNNSFACGLNTSAFGENSVAEGFYTLAIGNASHVEGYNTTASISYTHAEGLGSNAYGDAAHAEGRYTNAAGKYSHSEGNQTTAQGENSHAEGNQTKAIGGNSHAEGDNCVANDGNSHAEGWNSTAYGNCSHAETRKTYAYGSYSHSEGNETTAYGVASHAEGYRTSAQGNFSHTEGYQTSAYGYSHAEGNLAVATGATAHAEGYSTSANGNASHAEGNQTSAQGHHSHAEGSATSAAGQNSHVEGEGTYAAALYGSHAEGNHTSATHNATHAEGSFSWANGSAAHSEGSATSAFGNCSHAEGNSTYAIGNYSHAEGQFTSAIDDYTHAEGSNCRATGLGSHVEGYNCSALKQCSHAEGAFVSAYGDFSHAEGRMTTAYGKCSHAAGSGTKAYDDNMTVIGKNNYTTRAAFVIGNGESIAAGSDAFVVDWTGVASAVNMKTSAGQVIATNSTPTAGQILTYDGTNNSAVWAQAPIPETVELSAGSGIVFREEQQTNTTYIDVDTTNYKLITNTEYNTLTAKVNQLETLLTTYSGLWVLTNTPQNNG